ATAEATAVAVLGRTLQGAGAAFMTPAALSLVTSATRDRERTRALSVYGLATPLGFMAGTLAAGFVAAAVEWRAAIVASIVVALFGLALARRLPPDRALPATDGP